MRQKMILVLVVLLMLTVLLSSAYASWSINEGIDGYVYRCGTPVEGMIVQVYDSSGSLVGYESTMTVPKECLEQTLLM